MRVVLPRDVAGLLLSMARELHPREMIATLHGRVRKGEARVREVYLAPQSIYGEGFSAFNFHQMPIDLSFLGIAHSHPSGVGMPSYEDLNNMMGRVMIIVTAPYADERDIHAFDAEGRRLEVVITD